RPPALAASPSAARLRPRWSPLAPAHARSSPRGGRTAGGSATGRGAAARVPPLSLEEVKAHVAPPGRSPGSRVCSALALRAVPPSPPASASGFVGLAARLQWRDRAGIGPASLEAPFRGRHGGGLLVGAPNTPCPMPGQGR